MPLPEAAGNKSAGASLPQPDSSRGVRWLALILLFASGTAVRLLCLVHKPFWFDECFSVEMAWLDWRNFIHIMWWREANMALYYLLLRLWLHFGHTEFFIRSLSVVMAVATLPAIYWLARLLYNRRVAVIATALLTFNAYHVRYSQEARTYTLYLLLATLSSCFLIVVLREPTRRNRIAYALTGILAVYAHFYALLLLVAHWLAVRLLVGSGTSRDKELQEASISFQLRRTWIQIGVAVLPLLIFVAKTGAGPIRWVHRPSVHDFIAFCENLSGGNTWPLAAIFTVLCAAAVVPFRAHLRARAQSFEVWRCQFLLLWLLFPVVLTLVLSIIRPVFLTRYLIFCLPALLTLAAAGLARLRQAWLLAVAMTVVLLLAGQGIFFVYDHDFDASRDSAGAATNFILDRSQPGDAIIFHIPQIRIPYEFFRSMRAGQNTASANFTGHVGPDIVYPHYAAGLDYLDLKGKLSPDFVRTAAPRHPRVWVVLMFNGPKLPDPTAVMLSEVLPESFPKVQRWQFPMVEIRLYSRQ